MTAKLISKHQVDTVRYIGRLSDGSDRVSVPETSWQVLVRDNDGVVHQFTFDHNPSAQDVLDAIPSETVIVPTRKADLEAYLKALVDDWRLWRDLHVEAIAQGEAAGVVTALNNRRTAAWNDVRMAIIAWRTAA